MNGLTPRIMKKIKIMGAVLDLPANQQSQLGQNPLNPLTFFSLIFQFVGNVMPVLPSVLLLFRTQFGRGHYCCLLPSYMSEVWLPVGSTAE